MARGAVADLGQDAVGTGEAAGAGAAGAADLLHRPDEIGLDRRGAAVQIRAVEAEPGFQPQAVPRAQPDRGHRRIGQQRPGEVD